MRLLTIIATIPVTLTLVQRGVLTPEQAAFVLVAIIVSVIVVQKASRVILPTFAFAIFLTNNTSNSSELLQLLAPLLALVLCLVGIYIMLRGVFIGTQKKERH